MKAAIITYYYKNANYGGSLQAYALATYIRQKYSLDIEQLCYRAKGRNRSVFWKLRRKLSFIYHRYLKDIQDMKGIELRKKNIYEFNKTIPHNKEIYTISSINKTLDKYDIFIAGSDQVWNPEWSDSVYRMDFVTQEKVKISYAASMGITELEKDDRDILKKSLSTYNAISVREESLVKILQPLTNINIKWVLDPTLLLPKSDWDKICSNKKFGENYIFTYYLGESYEQRELALQFARKKKLKIITLPHLLGYCRECDKNYGDVKLYEVSPPDFISLIKNASYIFTDSFHASVFSILYEKEFFVFNRLGHDEMGTRIYTLMDLFDLSERFCDTKEKQCEEYIMSRKCIDYVKSFPKFDVMKKFSEDFLNEILGEELNKVAKTN